MTDFAIVKRMVYVDLYDAPVITGVPNYTSDHTRTIRPVRAIVTFRADVPNPPAHVSLTGPKIKDGRESASYYEVIVDVREGASQWLLDLVDAARS